MRQLVEDALCRTVERMERGSLLIDPDLLQAAAGGALLGVPQDRNLLSAYFRKGAPPTENADLDRDRCGLLWFTPALPADGAEVARAAALIEEIVLRHGFEPQLGLIPPSARLIYAITAIAWDRDRPGEDARARACHDELARALAARGHHPFRTGLQSGPLSDGEASYDRLLDALRGAIDPLGIFTAR